MTHDDDDDDDDDDHLHKYTKNTIHTMVMSVAKRMLFCAALLNYCYCGAIWGISFESFGFESL